MSFEAHGEANIYWLGQVLVIEPSGGINKEGSIGFSNKVLFMIESRPSQFWCRLEYVKDPNTLGTPDALVDFRETLINCKNNGCLKMSWLGGNSLLRSQFKMVCEQIDIPHQEYQDFENAIWDLTNLLNEQGN